jgi:hypothetical protein
MSRYFRKPKTKNQIGIKYNEMLAQANAEIQRLDDKNEKYRQRFLEAYRGACKHLGVNGMHPHNPQFLQDMFMDLEMWGYEDEQETEGRGQNESVLSST